MSQVQAATFRAAPWLLSGRLCLYYHTLERAHDKYNVIITTLVLALSKGRLAIYNVLALLSLKQCHSPEGKEVPESQRKEASCGPGPPLKALSLGTFSRVLSDYDLIAVFQFDK